MRAKFINEKFTEKSDPIVDMGIGPNKYSPTFDYKKIERKINKLKKLGYVVQKKLNGSEKYGYSLYWKIGMPGYRNHEGIGYHFTFKDDHDYFFHNSHSGPIEKPSTSPGSTWNTHSEKPGPGGWYTFDDKYILNQIDQLAALAERKKEDANNLKNIKY
jgi:hypothetical protein